MQFVAFLWAVWGDCLIRQRCLIRQQIADLGNMNLSNCVEFDNLTLNFSMGTTLSIMGYFPFTCIYYYILRIFTRREKILTFAERFLNNNWFLMVSLILLFYANYFSLFQKWFKASCHCTNNWKKSWQYVAESGHFAWLGNWHRLLMACSQIPVVGVIGGRIGLAPRFEITRRRRIADV